MSDWIHIDDQKPEDEQNVFYFFEVLGVYKGKYKKTQYPEEMFDEGTEPVYGDSFYSSKGFLTDDVTHWMPAPTDEEWDEVLPDVPVDYIILDGDGMPYYAHKDDVILVRRDDYEGLKEQVKYLEAGHLTGLVCPDCSHLHIYHDDEYDGYHCHGCSVTYDTVDVETNTYRYTSKYDRPCPNCNPHEKRSREFFQNGFLEYTKGVEPYSTEHYVCEKCDSTYCIGDI